MSDIDNIYPDFTNSRFDMKYAKRRILPSDLLNFKPPSTVINIRGNDSEEDTGEFSGTQILRTEVSTSTNISTEHTYLAVNAAAAPVNIQLFNSTLKLNHIVKFKKIDNTNNPVTLIPYGTQTIDEQASYELYFPKEGAALISTAAGWERIT